VNQVFGNGDLGQFRDRRAPLVTKSFAVGRFGLEFSKQNLFRMIQRTEVFSENQIVVTLSRQLT
jgi:hypothetical protein